MRQSHGGFSLALNMCLFLKGNSFSCSVLRNRRKALQMSKCRDNAETLPFLKPCKIQDEGLGIQPALCSLASRMQSVLAVTTPPSHPAKHRVPKTERRCTHCSAGLTPGRVTPLTSASHGSLRNRR